jgi:hypothetical protein
MRVRARHEPGLERDVTPAAKHVPFVGQTDVPRRSPILRTRHTHAIDQDLNRLNSRELPQARSSACWAEVRKRVRMPIRNGVGSDEAKNHDPAERLHHTGASHVETGYDEDPVRR